MASESQLSAYINVMASGMDTPPSRDSQHTSMVSPFIKPPAFVIIGAVVSSTVMVCTRLSVLLHSSITAKERVMVHVLGQSPYVVSTATVTVAPEQLSLAVAAS